MKILLFFIDGMGLGKKDTEINPFYRAKTPVFDSLLNEDLGNLVATDVSQGVSGIPQSATGQTALLTGKNAAKAMGRHKSGFPGPTLKNIIEKENIFKKLDKLKVDSTFANAYTPDYVQEIKNQKRRGSVTTYCVLNSSLQFRYLDDIKRGNAVYQDFTNKILINDGFNLKEFSAKTAAENLVNIVKKHDFTLYEYFQTDITGHSQNMNKAVNLLEDLDLFLETVVENLPANTLIIISSDHGNIEDLSIKTHSKNRVPTFLIGPDSDYAAENITKIQHITPMIVKLFKK